LQKINSNIELIMQKRIFTYLAIGGIYILALFTRFGEIVSPAIIYVFSAFVFILFAAFAILYLLKKKTINKYSFDISIVLFLVALVILIFTSKYKYGSVMETYKLISALLIAIMMMNLIETKKDLKIFLYNVVGLGLMLSIISYVFYAATISMVFNRSKIAEIAYTYHFTVNKVLWSIWQYQNTFGGFLILPLFVSYGLALNERNRDKKIIFSFISMFFIFILFLTTSRGAFLSCIAAFVLFLFLSNKKNLPIIFIHMLIILAGAFILILLGAPKEIILRNLGKTTTLIKYAGGIPNSSLWRRVHFAILSLSIFKKHPFFGTGLGTFKDMFCINEWVPDQFLRIDPHSLIFKFIAETGILGTSAFLFMIFRFFKRGVNKVLEDKKDLVIKGLFAGIAGMFVHMCLDVDIYPVMFVVLFTVLGAFTYGEKGKFSKSIKRTLLTIVAFLLIAISLFDIMPKAIASIYALRGDTSKTTSTKVEYYKKAKAVDTKNPLYPYYLAEIFEKEIKEEYNQDAITPILDNYKTAMQLNPNDYRFSFFVGITYLYMKDTNSIIYLKKTESLYPTAPQIKSWLAIAYIYTKGDTENANIYANKAFEIDTNDLNAYVAKGFCALKEKEYDKAYIYFTYATRKKMINSFAHLGLAQCYKIKGDLENELKELKRANKSSNLLLEVYKEQQRIISP